MKRNDFRFLRRAIRCLGLCLSGLFFAGLPARGLEEAFAGVTQKTPFASLSENLRLAGDLSSRVVFRSEEEQAHYQNVIGFDLYKVFSGSEGDWGTLILQGYLTRIDDRNPHPKIFSDEDDWKFVYRIFNFNYSGLGLGKPNIRVGHFEVPYGLEHVINTNGTLRQYGQKSNLGLKADWGISLNGYGQTMDYEVSLTQASGQDVTWRGLEDRYALTGRLGQRDWLDMVDVGVSAYYAELEADGGRRWRLGTDARWYYRRAAVWGEVSLGENEGDSILNGLLEFNLINNLASWLGYAQLFYYSQNGTSGWDEAVDFTVGVRYTPDNYWALSSQLKQGLAAFQGRQRVTELAFQIRYRF